MVLSDKSTRFSASLMGVFCRMVRLGKRFEMVDVATSLVSACMVHVVSTWDRPMNGEKQFSVRPELLSPNSKPRISVLLNVSGPYQALSLLDAVGGNAICHASRNVSAKRRKAPSSTLHLVVGRAKALLDGLSRASIKRAHGISYALV